MGSVLGHWLFLRAAAFVAGALRWLAARLRLAGLGIGLGSMVLVSEPRCITDMDGRFAPDRGISDKIFENFAGNCKKVLFIRKKME